MAHEKDSFIERMGQWPFVTSLGLLPLFFLPFTQDFYDTNKWLLLVVSALIIVTAWTVRSVLHHAVIIAWNSTTKSLGLLAVTALTSLLVASPNKVEAMVASFGPGTFLALFLIMLLGPTFLDEKTHATMRWVLYAAVSLTGLVAIYQFFGLARVTGLTGLPGLAYLADPLWTPVGTSVGLMTILGVTLPLLIGEILHRKKQGHDTHMITAFIMTIATAGGLLFTAIQALPLLFADMLPYWAAWQILLESYKNGKQLLVGVGVENFISAFTVGRPSAFNMAAAWSTRYTLSSSLLFHFATIYGVMGVAALGYFFISMIKGTYAIPILISRIVAIAALALLPPSFPALVLVVILLTLDTHEHSSHLALPKKPLLIYGAGIVILIALLGTSYGLFRTYSAELAFGKSLRSLEKREGTAAYNAQIEAISLSPNIARFHTSYSQTNLALANSLADTASGSATPDQIKKDRETATQLVQQAIREAKLAVSLAPKNILVWENIAAVYQELTGVAQGADQWTVAAYQQALQLDPTNPSLRLRMGGAYIGQQKFDRAAEQYIAAIELKPNYANAYYNLAFVYRETKKYLAAAQAIREALKYVTPGSDDAANAQNELDDLRDLLTEKEKAVLDNPEAVQTIKPQITPAPKSNTNPTTEPLSPLP